MRSYLVAQLDSGRFSTLAGVDFFAERLVRAIQNDIQDGTTEREAGRAMLAFWANLCGWRRKRR